MPRATARRAIRERPVGHGTQAGRRWHIAAFDTNQHRLRRCGLDRCGYLRLQRSTVELRHTRCRIRRGRKPDDSQVSKPIVALTCAPSGTVVSILNTLIGDLIDRRVGGEAPSPMPPSKPAELLAHTL